MAKEQVKFYICSNCKSTNVRYIFGFGNIFGILPKMRCGSCKTEGLFPLIVMDKDKLNRKNFASLKSKNNKPAKFFKMK